jgi:hypothetical protein
MPEQELESFQMLASHDWLRAVDHWRAKQDDIPSRNEAILHLVALSLDLATVSRAHGEERDVWDADVKRLEKQT